MIPNIKIDSMISSEEKMSADDIMIFVDVGSCRSES